MFGHYHKSQFSQLLFFIRRRNHSQNPDMIVLERKWNGCNWPWNLVIEQEPLLLVLKKALLCTFYLPSALLSIFQRLFDQFSSLKMHFFQKSLLQKFYLPSQRALSAAAVALVWATWRQLPKAANSASWIWNSINLLFITLTYLFLTC